MKELKGKKILKRINEIVNDFVKPFGVTAKLGTDFCYVHEDKTVYYSFAVPDRASKSWILWMHTLAPHIKTDVFLTSLLHEIGHHMTIDTIEPDAQAYSDQMKKFIEESEFIPDEAKDFMYFELPDEIEATRWGLNFISASTEYCKSFWEELSPLIIDFYNKNAIEIDLDTINQSVQEKDELEALTYAEVFGEPDFDTEEVEDNE